MKKLLMILCVLLLAAAVCGCAAPMIDTDAEKYSVGNAEIDKPVNNLVIDWPSGEVNIKLHDEPTVKLEEHTAEAIPEAKQMHWLLDGDTLTVRFSASAISLIPKKTLTVWLPKDRVLKRFKADMASADFTSEAFSSDFAEFDAASGTVNAVMENVGTVEADSASGDVSVKARTVSRLDAETASGNITASAERIGSVSAETASGSVSLSFGNTPSSTEIETASGDVKLALPHDADFTAEIDTASGEFICDFAVIPGKNVYVCGSGENKIEAETASGDIILTFSDR